MIHPSRQRKHDFTPEKYNSETDKSEFVRTNDILQ